MKSRIAAGNVLLKANCKGLGEMVNPDVHLYKLQSRTAWYPD